MYIQKLSDIYFIINLDLFQKMCLNIRNTACFSLKCLPSSCERFIGIIYVLYFMLEYQKNLWRLETEQEQGCRTGPPATQAGGLYSLESIPELLKRLKISSQYLHQSLSEMSSLPLPKMVALCHLCIYYLSKSIFLTCIRFDAIHICIKIVH